MEKETNVTIVDFTKTEKFRNFWYRWIITHPRHLLFYRDEHRFTKQLSPRMEKWDRFLFKTLQYVHLILMKPTYWINAKPINDEKRNV